MNQNLNPKVIICVSTYNGEKYIKNQIESLLKQDYKYMLEMMVLKIIL